MENAFDSIAKGLTEAIEFEQGKVVACREVIEATPLPKLDTESGRLAKTHDPGTSESK